MTDSELVDDTLGHSEHGVDLDILLDEGDSGEDVFDGKVLLNADASMNVSHFQ